MAFPSTAHMISRIGKYEIKSQLGVGGFGRVFRAYDPSVGRHVAIKLLATGDDPDMLGRFRAEAGTTGNLRHKNIVIVHEFGEHEGLPYIVMEMLEGEELDKVIARHEPLPLLEKLQIMFQVAEGLRYAHHAGVIHRDIKPANIMLLPGGLVKIMDFGIARLTGRHTTRRTQKGEFLGTILYFAPEQFSGEDADKLTDIFSYGAIYYELLTGIHPFEAKDPGAIMYRITSTEPPLLRSLSSGCPEALETIVQRALEKDRALRYQSIDDLLFDTQPILLRLRQKRAAEIVREVPPLIDSGDLPSAQVRLHAALELDEANLEGRRLREMLQQRLQRDALRSRMATLLEEGEAHLSQRRFREAIRVLESALRLDKSDSLVRSRLEQARAAMEAARRSAKLVSDARSEAERGDLTGALASVLAALEADPESSEATALREGLQQQIENQKRQQQLEEALSRAEAHRLSQEFDRALAVLAELEQEQRGLPEVEQARERVRADQAEAERRRLAEYFRARATELRELLAARRLAEASGLAEELARDFPDEPVTAELIAELQEQLAARRRAEAVVKISQQVRTLLRQKQFSDARHAAEEGLRRYPGEAALERVLETIAVLEAAEHRAQEILETIRRSEELRDSGQLEEALTTLSALGPDPESFEAAILRESLQQQIEDRKRQQRLEEALSRAETHRLSQEFERALAVLAEVEQEQPGLPEVEQAHERVRADQAEEERRRFAEHLRLRAAELRELLAERRLAEASGLAEELARDFPDQPVIAELIAELQQQLAVRRRAEVVAKIDQQVRALLRQKRFSDARHAAEGGLRAYPGETALERALETIAVLEATEHRAQEILETIRRSEELRDSGQLEEALATLSALGADPESVQAATLRESLQQQVEDRRRQQRLEEALSRAEAHRLSQEFDRALAILGKLEQEQPGLAEVEEAHERVRADQAMEERRRLAEHFRLRAAKLREMLAVRRLAEASGLAGALAREFPDEPITAELIAELQEQLAARRRAEAVAKIDQQVRAWLRQKRFSDARHAAEKGLLTYPGETSLERALETIAVLESAEQRAQQTSEAIRRSEELHDSGQLEAALAVVSAAVEKFSDEPALAGLKQRIEFGLEQRRYVEGLQKLVEKARGLLANDKPGSAIQALERAEPQYAKEADVVALLAEARRARLGQDERKCVAEVLEQVAALEAAGQLRASLEVVEQALKWYPENTSLLEVAERLREKVRSEDRQIRINAHRELIEQAISAAAWSRAAAAVAAAGREFPQERHWQKLADRLVQGRREAELSVLRAAIDRSVAASDLEEAARCVQSARDTFSDEQVWKEMFQDVERRRAYRDALIEGQQATARGEYVQAQELLKRLIAANPLDNKAAVLLQVAIDRQAAVTRTLGHCEDLKAKGRLQEAVEFLAAALREIGHEPVLASLKQQLDVQLESQLYADGLHSVLEEGRRLLVEDRPGAAMQALGHADARYSREADFVALLAEARQAKLTQDEQEYVRSVIARVSSLEGNQQFRAALEQTEQALRRYPNNQALEESAEHLRDRMRAEERLSGIDGHRKLVERALKAGAWERAGTAIARAESEFPEEERWQTLKEELRWTRREADLKLLRVQVEQLLAAADLDAAFQRLEATREAFSGDQTWQSLQGELEQRRTDQAAITEAQEATDRGDLDRAEQIIERLVVADPSDRRIAKLLRNTKAARARKERELKRTATAAHPRSTEHVSAAALSAPVDPFAFALMTYTALTGHHPFEAANFLRLMQTLLRGQPRPVEEWRRELPAELNAVFGRALGRNPRVRYASTVDLLRALATILGGEPAVWKLFEKVGALPARDWKTRVRDLLLEVREFSLRSYGWLVAAENRWYLYAVTAVLIAALLIGGYLTWPHAAPTVKPTARRPKPAEPTTQVPPAQTQKTKLATLPASVTPGPAPAKGGAQAQPQPGLDPAPTLPKPKPKPPAPKVEEPPPTPVEIIDRPSEPVRIRRGNP